MPQIEPFLEKPDKEPLAPWVFLPVSSGWGAGGAAELGLV